MPIVIMLALSLLTVSVAILAGSYFGDLIANFLQKKELRKAKASKPVVMVKKKSKVSKYKSKKRK